MDADFIQRIANSFWEHLWLLVGLGGVARFGLPWALRYVLNIPPGQKLDMAAIVRRALGIPEDQKVDLPAMMHNTLTQWVNNGGGAKISELVKAENQRQSQEHQALWRSMLREALEAHEREERAEMERALRDFRSEITDKWALSRRAPRRAR